MKLIKVIQHSMTIMNLLLLTAVFVLFFVFAYPLIKKEVKVVIPNPKVMRAQDEKKQHQNDIAYSDYFPIIDKNMFHPERVPPAEKKEEKRIIRPEIILHGTLIIGERKIAYIEDKKNPYSTPGRGKRQVALAPGSSIGSYTLKEINPESIILVYGEDKMIVNLRDQKDRKYNETKSQQSLQQGRISTTTLPNQIQPALRPLLPTNK